MYIPKAPLFFLQNNECNNKFIIAIGIKKQPRESLPEKEKKKVKLDFKALETLSPVNILDETHKTFI